MYKEITIENIKTFEKEQKLKIAPITLIYGENSSGKTTLLKILDIVHNIFTPWALTRDRDKRATGTPNPERGSFEDIKNISARKIHFFSSQINKKPLQIELTLNLPFPHIDQRHPLYSNNISEKYEYFEENIPPQRGKGKTISQKTFGTSTYKIDRMPDGSIRKMVIRDTGEGSGNKKKFRISALGSSRIFRSKDKVKMVPTKFFIEIKFFPGLKLSKVNKLEIKNINNKTLISFLRIPKQYSFPKDISQYGYLDTNGVKQNMKRHTKENPDFFTSDAGYADYKINIEKENNIWLKAYKYKYERIFSDDEKINIRLNKIKLLFQALINYKYVWLSTSTNINNEMKWRAFSYLVTCYIFGNNKTEYPEMEKTIKSLFQFSDKNFPRDLNMKNINTLVNEQFGGESIKGDIAWNTSKYIFSSNIIKKHSNAKKYYNEIYTFSELLTNADSIDLFVIQNFLNKKVSFKKFCVEARNSYEDCAIRFKRTPSIFGMDNFNEIEHSLVNRRGQKQSTNFDILLSFSDYIYGDITKAFDYSTKSGARSKGRIKLVTPHYLINNCLSEIKRTVQEFIPCLPNKTETPYNIPMEEEFNWEEIEKAIGPLRGKERRIKNFKKYFKSKGIKFKEITVSSPDYLRDPVKAEMAVAKKL